MEILAIILLTAFLIGLVLGIIKAMFDAATVGEAILKILCFVLGYSFIAGAVITVIVLIVEHFAAFLLSVFGIAVFILYLYLYPRRHDVINWFRRTFNIRAHFEKRHAEPVLTAKSTNKELLRAIDMISKRVRQHREHCMGNETVIAQADRLLALADRWAHSIKGTPVCEIKAEMIIRRIGDYRGCLNRLADYNYQSAVCSADALITVRDELETHITALDDAVQGAQ